MAHHLSDISLVPEAKPGPTERVLAALEHRRPDRLPRYDVFLPGFVKRWNCVHRGAGAIHDYYAKLDIGTVMAYQEGPLAAAAFTETSDGDYYLARDTWGRLSRHSRHGFFFEVLETAFDRKGALDQLRFDNPREPARYAGFREQVPGVRRRFAPVCGVMGPFMASYYLRGEYALMVDLMEDEAFCQALAGRVAGYLAETGEEVLEVTGAWNTAIWVYDEFASGSGALISPDTFERVYLPAYRRMTDAWKARGVRNIILHCDGNCSVLLDLLLEAGITGLQGAYPSTGMSVPALRARYGARLSVVGGMCNTRMLACGAWEEIRRHAEELAEIGRDGGLIIGSHSLDDDIAPEHYDFYCSVLDALDDRW